MRLQVFESNPLVQKIRSETGRTPLPLTLFADSVRYTSPLAGRASSILGIFLRTGVTQRRHLLAAVRSSKLCRCGCRGWCTLSHVWSYIASSLRSLALGRRTNTLFTGEIRDTAHPYSIESAGEKLHFNAVLLWVTGHDVELAFLAQGHSDLNPSPGRGQRSAPLFDMLDERLGAHRGYVCSTMGEKMAT